MKKTLPALFSILFFCFLGAIGKAQTVLVDYNFQTIPMPAALSSNVKDPSTGKSADNMCSKGALEIDVNGYLQVEVASCERFSVNMKSSGPSARTLTVLYKRDGDAAYTTAGSVPVQAAASFALTEQFPELKSAVPISIRLEVTKGGKVQIHDLYVSAGSSVSTAAEILRFSLPGQLGTEVINSAAGTVDIRVPVGTPLAAVVPSEVTLSAQATISPAATAAQDFTSEVLYTVTAQDGTTTKSWKVRVTPVASGAKEITAFKLSNDQIGAAFINSAAGTITVDVPLAASLSGLAPVQLSISSNATISPAATDVRDFSNPVNYVVTAQDLSTKTWTITVNKVDPNAVFTNYEAEDAQFTGKTDNQHANYSGTGFVDFLVDGENSIVFTVCQQQAGSQTAKFRYALAKDDLRPGQLFVNDVLVKTLAFARTATFTDWTEEVATVTLQQGINTIRITWDETDGPNLDRLSLSGAPCATYTLLLNTTNGGNVSLSPERAGNRFFEGETVSILAENKPDLQFQSWSGDVTGTRNPEHLVMNGNKTVTANFMPVATYKLNLTINGLGQVELSPAGGEYSAGMVVTLTPKTVLNSTFTGWAGDVSGAAVPQTITMTSDKKVTANFTSDFTFDFDKPVGFASVVTTTYPDFNGPTTGGLRSKDTLWINGPAQFDLLATTLYDRIKAYKNKKDNGLAKYAPLTIILKEGTYTGTGTSATTFANAMLTVQEQGDLTIMGEKNVVLNFGINIKRGWNILIRNLSFQDYYDDGINIGEPETHHIWIDHCTVGHPTTMPKNTEHPDGGIDVKGGASYVTISFCKYQNSWKTGLVGHSDSNKSEDQGKLFVTYFGNYFYHTNSRNPRVRFGQVHVLNNLEEQVMLYGIAAANTAQVYAEGNFFLNTRWAMYADRTVSDFKAVFGNNTDNTFTSKTGNYPAQGLKQVNNAYDDSGLPVITAQINPAMLNPGGRSVKFDEFNPGQVFTPSAYYNYTALDPEAVRVLVPLLAGADKLSFKTAAQQSPLPLNFLSVQAKYARVSKSVVVDWKTANEVNTDRFEVLRSSDGRNFIAIGTVAAKNTAGENPYRFEDKQPLPSTSYYRLKQVDKDGKLTYSRTVTVGFSTNLALSVSPNPANNSLLVSHEKAQGSAVLKIVSVQGQVLAAVQPSADAFTTPVDVSKLPAGNYLLVFENGNNRYSTIFVKQ